MKTLPQLLIVLITVTGCAANSEISTSRNPSFTKAVVSKQFIAEPPIPNYTSKNTAITPEKIEDLFTIHVDKVPLVEFIQALAIDANLEISFVGKIEGLVSLVINNRTLTEIIDEVEQQLDIRFELQGKNLRIIEDTPFVKIYNVDYLNIERTTRSEIELATQIDSISIGLSGNNGGLTSSNNSRASVHNASDNKFWLHLKDNLELILGKKKNDLDGLMLNQEAGLVVVRAKYHQQKLIEQYISTAVESAQRQVFIEALIVEVSLSNEFQAGIDWRVLSQGESGNNYIQNFTGEKPVKSTNIDEYSAPAALFSIFKKNINGSDIIATLSLLEQFGQVKILSSPKINALNNQSAVLKVVDNRVYFSVGIEKIQTQDSDEKLTTTSKIRTVPIGLVMNVIPNISRDGEIILNVRPTISRILGFVTDPNPELAKAGVHNLVPEIQVREMESVLRVQSGGMVVMGGLMQERESTVKVGIPILGDIPLLGLLFRYEKNITKKTELLVFIRPVVIENQFQYKDSILKEYGMNG